MQYEETTCLKCNKTFKTPDKRCRRICTPCTLKNQKEYHKQENTVLLQVRNGVKAI